MIPVRLKSRSWYGYSLLFILIFIYFVPNIGAQEIDMDEVHAQEEFRWGVKSFHAGFFNEAIVSLRKALAFKPDNSLIRYWLGLSQYYSGYEEAALNEWELILQNTGAEPFVEYLYDIVKTRRGLGRELRPPERYVVANEIPSIRDESVLFKRPSSVRARKDGTFFIISHATHQILVADANGNIIRTYNGGLEGFDHPFDIAEAEDGTLYVSEYWGDRIAKCSANGIKIETFGETGRGDGQLLGPQFVALDADGYVYVSDYGNRRICKFDDTGNFILSFGRKSTDFPGFLSVSGIAIIDEKIFVADTKKKKIFGFDLSGNYLGTIVQSGLEKPEGISVFDEQRLLISDSTRLLLLDIEKETLALISDLEGDIRLLISSSIDANGNIITADYDYEKVAILTELSSMYSGLFAQVNAIKSNEFPKITIEASVQDRYGENIVGLTESNFYITENNIPINEPDMVFAGYKTKKLAVNILVERSPFMIDFTEETYNSVLNIGELVGTNGLFGVINADESPTIGLDLGRNSFAAAEYAAYDGNYSKMWNFDLGLRLAASNILGIKENKAVIFITQGQLPQNIFDDYGLLQSMQYLKNNGIQFYTLYLKNNYQSPELDFIAKETGGGSYYIYDPRGIGHMIDHLKNTKNGNYVFTFTSESESNFGTSYIPLKVETIFLRKSGRAESGYFAPLEY
jgi:DNA-binding beta-propeller fold protein YncE